MMKFKLHGWPHYMMGISMRMSTQLVVFDHLQVKMSWYKVPEHILPQQVIAWYNMSSHGIIGPIFLGDTVTLNVTCD